MHWTRRVGLLCLGLVSLGLTKISSGQDPIAATNGGVVYLDDFSGSAFLSSDGGNYLLFHKVVGDGVGRTDGFSRLGVRTRLWEGFGHHVFGEAHALVTDDSRAGFNVGGGYRCQSGGGILGVHGWFDDYESNNKNRYRQVTGGIEYLHPTFDLRANGYIPIDERENFVRINDPGDTPRYSGNNIVTDGIGTFERAFYGWDVEGGGPVPLAQNWLRAYGGVYQLLFSDDSATGFRARAEARFMEGVNLNLVLSDDDKFGTNLNLGVEVRFRGTMPTRFQSGYTADRRYDQVRRTWNVQINEELDDIVIPLNRPGTADPIMVSFVDNTAAAGGDGTFEMPFDFLPDMVDDADLILVRRGAGDTLGNITLLDDQRLLGEGLQHFVDTDRLGVIPLPTDGFDPSGAAPILRPAAAGLPIVTLANRNEVRSFELAGSDGIFGTDIDSFAIDSITSTEITNGINIMNAGGTGLITNIDFEVMPGGTGVAVSNMTMAPLDLTLDTVAIDGGAFGVVVDADGADVVFGIDDLSATNATDTGLLLAADGADLSGTADNVVVDGNAGTGVALLLNNATGTTVFDGLQASGNGVDGVRVVATTGTVYDLDILDSTIDFNLDDNIDTDVVDMGSVLNLFVDPTTMDGAGDNAFEFFVSDEGTLNATLLDVSLTGAGNDAIDGSVTGGSVANLDVTNFDASGSMTDGLDLTVTGQSLLTGVFTDGNFDDSAFSAVNVFSSTQSVVDLAFDNVTANSMAVNGGAVYAVQSGSQVSSTWTGGSISGTQSDGIRGNVQNVDSELILGFDGVVVNGNTGDGLQLNALNGGRFDASVINSSFSINASNAFQGTVDGPDSTGRLTVDSTTANASGEAGGNFLADNGGALGLGMSNSSFSGSGMEGLRVTASNDSTAAVLLTDVALNFNGLEGLSFDVLSGSELSLLAEEGIVFSNGLAGVFSGVRGNVEGVDSAASVSFDSTQVIGNTSDGFAFNASGGSAFIGELMTSGNFLDNLTVSNNVGAGVSLDATNPGTQAGLIMNGENLINNNGSEGLRVNANGIDQLVVLAAGSFDNNGANGLSIDAMDVTSTSIEVSNSSSFNENVGHGIGINLVNTELLDSGVTTLTQSLTVDGFQLDQSEASRNAGNGIDINGDGLVAGNMDITNMLLAENGGDGLRIGLLDSTIGTLSLDGNASINNLGNGVHLDFVDSQIELLDVVNNSVGGNMVNGILTDLDNTPILNLNVSGNEAGVTVGMMAFPIDDTLPIIRPGFNLNTLAGNDDGSTGLVSLGFDANFFGQVFSDTFVNNNGNITFGAPLATFTPFGLLNTTAQIIAPFFADVDTRDVNGLPTANVTFSQGTVGGRQAFGVNWLNVRHFDAPFGINDGLPTNSFQLVLIDRSDIRAGDFDIEFNFGQILWEAGEASGSDGFGLGGDSARVGFSNGVNTAFELNGSGVNGAFLDSGPAGSSLIQNSLNSSNNGRYLFFARDGMISTAGTLGNGGDGVQLNAMNNSDIGVLTIDKNILDSNGARGLSVTANTGSDIDVATISNNQVSNSGSHGIVLDVDDSILSDLRISTNSVNLSLGSGILIDVTNGGVMQNLSVDNNVLDMNAGGPGLSISLDNTDLVQGNVQANIVTGNNGDGIDTSFDMTTGGSLAFVGNEITGNTGAGLTVSTLNSTFTDLTVDSSLIEMNMGGDGVLFSMLNSEVTNALTVSNNFIEENGGNGLELDLNGTPIANLLILDNLGAAIPPSNIGFSVDVRTAQHWDVLNLSPAGTFLTNLDFDLAPAGVSFAVTRANGAEFELFGGANVGIVTVNGLPVDLMVVPQPGIITEAGTTVDFIFNDFDGGETFNHFDIEYGPGTTVSTVSGDLLGATAIATFSTGEVLNGVFDAIGQINVLNVNPGTGAGIFGNAENGILLSAANGSDIGAISIDGNRLDQNALGGILFEIDDSTLPAPGAPAVVSNNIITDQQNGDGFAMLNPDTNGNAIGIDFLDNTITGSFAGSGINIALDTNAGGMTSEVSGNTISNNLGFGLRVNAIDDVNLDLVIGDSAGAANTFDANVDAGIAISEFNNVTSTISLENTVITNTVDGADADFAGEGLAILLTDQSELTSLDIGDAVDLNTSFETNAAEGVRVEALLDTTLTDVTLQNFSSTGNIGDGLSIFREGSGVVDNVLISNATVSGNGADGIDIVASLGNLTDDYTILDSTITGNGGRGLSLEARFDGDIMATIMNNVIGTNGDDGVSLTQVTIAMIDSPTITADFIENDISMNAGFGVDVQATHDLSFDGNTIDNNRLGGINLAVAALDPLDVITIANGSVSNNGTTGAGGSGITIGDVDNTVSITNNMINGNGNLENGVGDGITSLAGADTTISDNTISNNADNGIALQNGTHTINNNLIQLNGLANNPATVDGDGIQLVSDENGGLVVMADMNTIQDNRGRGLNLLVQGNTLADVTFSNGRVEGNRMEGVYVVTTTSLTQNVDASANSALNSNGDLFATPELVFNFDSNEVLSNGVDSTFSGTGLVLRVGTSGASNAANAFEDNGGFVSDGGGFTAANLTGRGGVLASITNSDFIANPGSDVLIESFDSTVNPATTTGTWNAATYNITTYEQDSLARLDLNFTGNNGDDTNVVRAGASFNNAEAIFKSRTTGQTDPGPFNAANRLRNGQRLAGRSAPFDDPALNFVGVSGDTADFLYSGVGESTFRVTFGSDTAGFAAGDDFGDVVPLGVDLGELPFGYGLIP